MCDGFHFHLVRVRLDEHARYTLACKGDRLAALQCVWFHLDSDVILKSTDDFCFLQSVIFPIIKALTQ